MVYVDRTVHLLSLFLQLRRRFKQGVPLTRHLEILTSKNLLVFDRNEDVSAYITVVICHEPLYILHSSKMISLAALLIFGSTTQEFLIPCNAFQHHQMSILHSHHHSTKDIATRLYVNPSNDNTGDSKDTDDIGDSEDNIFAALPPIGESSFWERQDEDNDTVAVPNTSSSSSISPTKYNTNIVLSRKFHLQYTCKICSTRNTHSLTRLGYNHGVVIAVCKECNNKHLIADNLGWSHYLVNGFDVENGENNIEEYVRNRQREDGSSLRVGKGVFDLENLWHEEEKNGVAMDGKEDNGPKDWN